MSPTAVPFVGSGEYCYANSASMLLASIGEKVDAPLIESMTAVGAGARLWQDSGMIYFSILPPDIGLSRAFQSLGVGVTEQAWASEACFPERELGVELDNGPVLVGPLDMQYLSYLPGHSALGGIDHYVVVTSLDDGWVRVHDPKGYPNIRLSRDDFENAWRASSITYSRGAFRLWSRPRRLEAKPDQRELAKRCILAFKAAYEWESQVPRNRVVVGRQAFADAAEILRGRNAHPLAGMLVAFGFPLGARRCLDLATLIEHQAPALAEIKVRQSLAFVDGYRHLVDADHLRAASVLGQLGELEDKFRASLSSY